MKALREQNIVHRDLKPGNILIKKDQVTGKIKVKIEEGKLCVCVSYGVSVCRSNWQTLGLLDTSLKKGRKSRLICIPSQALLCSW